MYVEGDWKDNIFFQTKDGIRKLVPSRGVGDVYKGQVYIILHKKYINKKKKKYVQ